MLPENDAIFTFTNLKNFHNAGYTGKGINVSVYEQMDDDHYILVHKSVSQICPDANIVDIKCDENGYANIKKNNIHILNMSQTNAPFESQVKQAYDENVTLVMASGNFGINKMNADAYLSYWLSVGAAYLMGNKFDGEIKLHDYSSTGDALDTIGLIPFVQGDTCDFQGEGTSFSDCFISGCLACWFQYYFEMTGCYPTPQEAYSFTINNSTQPNGQKGFNDEWGNGIFKMPSTLPTIIKLQIDNKIATINSKQVVLTVSPLLVSGRTLVPIRFISENLGFKVTWTANNKPIIISDKNNTIEITINSTNVKINGVDNKIDVAPQLIGDTTYVPLRFISETLGKSIRWISDTKEIIIS